MKKAFLALPGPIPIKVLLAIIIVVVFFIVLFSVYDWMGANLLDSGGGVG
ncbi:MAG: hypothetical protein R6W79_08330 [Acidimicrobiia bacterium]